MLRPRGDKIGEGQLDPKPHSLEQVSMVILPIPRTFWKKKKQHVSSISFRLGTQSLANCWLSGDQERLHLG